MESSIVPPSRHLMLSDDDRKTLLKGTIPQNTKNATTNWIRVVNSYFKQRKIANNIDEILDVDLLRSLELLYSEVTKDNNKTKKGDNKENIKPERYCNTSMRAMRAAIKRYIAENRKGLDVIANDSFSDANKMFEAVLKTNKEMGKGSIQHKKPIVPEDREKLNDYFSRYMEPNALILQQMVQFNLMFYLCRCGRENLTRMPKDTFEVDII